MLPLLVFASGVVAGVVGVRALKSVASPDSISKAGSGIGTIGARAQSGIGQAQSAVRDATVSGLSAIERTSAQLRARLEAPPEPAEPPADPPPAVAAAAMGEP